MEQKKMIAIIVAAIAIIALIAAAVLLTSGNGNKGGDDTGDVSVTGITLNKSAVTLKPGASETLTPEPCSTMRMKDSISLSRTTQGSPEDERKPHIRGSDARTSSLSRGVQRTKTKRGSTRASTTFLRSLHLRTTLCVGR